MSPHDLIRNVLKVLITELSPFDEVYDERRYSIFELRRTLISLFETDLVIRDPMIKCLGRTRDELQLEVSYTAEGVSFALDIFQRGRGVRVVSKSA
jgi:hypothetical protein